VFITHKDKEAANHFAGETRMQRDKFCLFVLLIVFPFILMKYFVCIKRNSVNVAFLPSKCSSVNCCKYATFQKRGEISMNFFHHTIGPNNPQGLSDGKKYFFGCKNLNMSM